MSANHTASPASGCIHRLPLRVHFGPRSIASNSSLTCVVSFWSSAVPVTWKATLRLSSPMLRCHAGGRRSLPTRGRGRPGGQLPRFLRPARRASTNAGQSRAKRTELDKAGQRIFSGHCKKKSFCLILFFESVPLFRVVSVQGCLCLLTPDSET